MSAIHHSHARSNTPQHILMVRPIGFRPNEQTAHDNTFQQSLPQTQADQASLGARAVAEFDAMVKVLNANDIAVSVFDAIDQNTPDAVFPNNWLSTHPSGMLVTYPMYCENRRAERRIDIVNYLKSNFHVTQHVDLSEYEKKGLIAEGTGAMVIDHANKLAYVCLSQRANLQAIEKACSAIGVTPVCFNAFNEQGVPVYHTNVMMSVGSDFAIIASDMISPKDRPSVLSTLEETGKTLLHIKEAQVNAFAGNCLELLNCRNERFLILSSTACASLSEQQRASLPVDLTLLPISVPTIEMAGGSVRCMMAGIHLASKTAVAPQQPPQANTNAARIRLVREGDLDSLLALAKAASPGMTTFPPDPVTLDAKLKRSLVSEQKLYHGQRPDYLLFVLEDLSSNTLIGTSAIFGELGKEESFYSYKREKVTQRNHALNAHYTHDVLYLSHHYEGYAEVASLYLLPQYRQQYNGKLLTKVRYLFMGLHKHVFPEKVMADLRGYVDKNGQSPFWDAVGSHFFPMSYVEADLYGAVNGNQFIADLMPKLPLYVNMLPSSAQRVIGKPHDEGKPAMALLEKEGFRFTHYIDIFDGAPSMEADIAQLNTVQRSQRATVKIEHPSRIHLTNLQEKLVATLTTPFYAMVASVRADGDIVVVSQQTAQALGVMDGECILLSDIVY